MQLKTFLIINFLIAGFGLKAQLCSRTVSMFQMAPGGYIINGTASLNEFTGNMLELSFDGNFNTTAGPDLHVFLSQTFAPGNANNLNKVLIAPLISNTGVQVYAVPQGININDFDYVIIHCLTFNHFWGGGQLGTVIGNCLSSGIDRPESEKEIIIYPNPANSIINLKNIEDVNRVIVYNGLGSIVLNERLALNLHKTELDISALAKGLYILKLEQNTGSSIQRFTIQKL